MLTKRYFVFLGDTYYPVGGWWDFKGSFDTIELAKDFLLTQRYDWCQIVDSHIGLQVNVTG